MEGEIAVLMTILVPLGAFALVILIVRIISKSEVRQREMVHKERLALIEKGVTEFPEEFTKGINLPRYMVWGFILSAFGLALIIGLAISGVWQGPVAGLIFLFIGLALLLFYRIQSKKEEAKSVEETPHN